MGADHCFTCRLLDVGFLPYLHLRISKARLPCLGWLRPGMTLSWLMMTSRSAGSPGPHHPHLRGPWLCHALTTAVLQAQQLISPFPILKTTDPITTYHLTSLNFVLHSLCSPNPYFLYVSD